MQEEKLVFNVETQEWHHLLHLKHDRSTWEDIGRQGRAAQNETVQQENALARVSNLKLRKNASLYLQMRMLWSDRFMPTALKHEKRSQSIPAWRCAAASFIRFHTHPPQSRSRTKVAEPGFDPGTFGL